MQKISVGDTSFVCRWTLVYLSLEIKVYLTCVFRNSLDATLDFMLFLGPLLRPFLLTCRVSEIQSFSKCTRTLGTLLGYSHCILFFSPASPLVPEMSTHTRNPFDILSRHGPKGTDEYFTSTVMEGVSGTYCQFTLRHITSTNLEP